MELPLEPADITQRGTFNPQANSVSFRRTPVGVYDWHIAPLRLCVVTVQGRYEIEVGSGETRRFGPGDVTLFEDRLLARALHARAEIGDEIPADLFEAVAAVLAYVYRVERRTVGV